jgi:putative lipoprotein
MKSLLTLLLLGAVAAGCASSGRLGDATGAVGPTWTLVALGDDAPEAEATLTFGDDGRVFGTTGCNRYFGSFALAYDGALTLTGVGSTRMACPPAEMAPETRFLDALNGAERVVVTGDRLVLVTTGGPQLTFRAMPSESADATLTGTVTYRPRIALPPNAVLSVKLLDVSRADAPSVTLTETRVGTDGDQVPLPFSLDYASADVEPRNRYVVRAEIFDAAGVLLWTTDTAVPVLTQGAPRDGVEVVLAQVTEVDPAGTLVGRTWRLSEIREASGVTLSYEGEAPFTLSFGADGRYDGRADCNRYGGAFEAGAFEAGPSGSLRLSQGLSTLAACPGPSVSEDFFDVLNGVDRYVLAAGRLTLSGPEGALVFE